jgi:hypothetical protein
VDGGEPAEGDIRRLDEHARAINPDTTR